MTPLLVHPYNGTFEGLRDAADALKDKQADDRNSISPKSAAFSNGGAQNYASDFFQARGFEVLAREAKSDAAAAAAAFAISGNKIAVICSTDKRSATTVELTRS